MRCQNEPSVTLMSISAWPSILPLSPLPACVRASATSLRDKNSLNSSAMRTTINGPPTNSATANCQPISTMMMMVNSATKFVEASSNAIAAVKSAPLRKIDRARATAAYEQEDDAAPRPHAIASDLGESFGNNRVISLLETTACTTADKPKPRMRGHKISQNMANAIQRAWPRAVTMSMIWFQLARVAEQVIKAQSSNVEQRRNDEPGNAALDRHWKVSFHILENFVAITSVKMVLIVRDSCKTLSSNDVPSARRSSSSLSPRRPPTWLVLWCVARPDVSCVKR